MTQSVTRDVELKSAPLVLFMTTSILALKYLFAGQVRSLRTSGLRVATAASPVEDLSVTGSQRFDLDYAVGFRRSFSPFADVVALVQTWLLIRRIKPRVIHTHTPKAGLLGMIASALSGVKVRIYTVNGLVLATRRGWQRLLLRFTEMIACRLAHQVVCVSHSLKEEIVGLGLCPANKIRVLGHGSSHGVSLERFRSASPRSETASRVRAAYEISKDAVVVAFVGRLVRDKGIEILAEAWQQLSAEFSNLHLLLCGGFEAQDAVSHHVVSALENDARVHSTGGFVDDMPTLYSAIDVCVLPTFREGFPNVPLECGAMEIPIVATRVTGCVDAVIDEKTGLLVPAGDPTALAAALRRLVLDPELRVRLGKQARIFVASRFSEAQVNRQLLEFYRCLLSDVGFALPEPITVSGATNPA